MANKTLKEITGMPLVDLREVNASVEGIFMRTEKGQYGDNFIMQIDGKEHLLFSSSVLATKMNQVALGKYVKITYLGEVKGKEGRLYKDFKVEVEA